MKYPKFTLPNSLMILRKYKKQNPSGQSQTRSEQTPLGQTLPAGSGGTGAAGAASGIL